MSGIEFPPVLFGALIGAIITCGLFWLKNVRDEVTSRSSEFASALREFSENGAKFWLCRDEDERRLLRARILGGQAFIDGYTVIACRRFSEVQEGELRLELAFLYNHVSGGDFVNEATLIDAHRAQDCQVSGSRVIVLLMSTAAQSITLRAQILRFCERSWHWFRAGYTEYRRLSDLGKEWSANGTWPRA